MHNRASKLGTNLALQHAETALVNVHNRVVDTLPLVDHLIIVHARNDKRRWVVARGLALALGDRFGLVPAVGARALLFCLEHVLEEGNVAARKQVEAAVHVDHALADLRAAALDKLAQPAGGIGGRGILPEPHVDAGVLGCLVGRVQAHPLCHGRASGLPLGLCAGPFLACKRCLERPQKVRLGTEQHAADKVRSRDARRALDDLEAVGRLDKAVTVLAGAVRGDVVAMHYVAAAKVRNPVERCHVGRVGHRLGHPPACIDGKDALAQEHDRRSLILKDGLVRVHANVQLVAELAGLDNGASMAWSRV